MILIKPKNSSPGSRHKLYIKKIFCKNKLFWWQKISKKKNIGRTNINGILTYSKVSKALRKSINYTEKRYITKRLGVFLSFINYYNDKSYYGIAKFSNGAYFNIAVPHGFLPGDFLKCTNLVPSRFTKYFLGDSVLLSNLTRRHIFYNVFLFFKGKCIFAKAAGTFCCMVSNDTYKNYARLKLPSGDVKLIYNDIFVTLGRNSNMLQKSIVYGKAGDVVKLGYKSIVRGVAMNPVDHPHGGRTKTNSPEKTPWGKIAKNNK